MGGFGNGIRCQKNKDVFQTAVQGLERSTRVIIIECLALSDFIPFKSGVKTESWNVTWNVSY